LDNKKEIPIDRGRKRLAWLGHVTTTEEVKWSA